MIKYNNCYFDPEEVVCMYIYNNRLYIEFKNKLSMNFSMNSDEVLDELALLIKKNIKYNDRKN